MCVNLFCECSKEMSSQCIVIAEICDVACIVSWFLHSLCFSSYFKNASSYLNSTTDSSFLFLQLVFIHPFFGILNVKCGHSSTFLCQWDHIEHQDVDIFQNLIQIVKLLYSHHGIVGINIHTVRSLLILDIRLNEGSTQRPEKNERQALTTSHKTGQLLV